VFDSLRCVACSSERQWTTVQWRKQMKKHPFRNATFFLCTLMLAFVPWARAQEQTNPAPQARAKPPSSTTFVINSSRIPSPLRRR
jgi:hypothetical protein